LGKKVFVICRKKDIIANKCGKKLKVGQNFVVYRKTMEKEETIKLRRAESNFVALGGGVEKKSWEYLTSRKWGRYD